jgi:Ser/Thr protein kinase RdoA (MazF antagonist)
MVEAAGAVAKPADADIELALASFAELEQAEAVPLGAGLINETFEVRAKAGHYVLQRLNPIFDPAIHHNIRAVTVRLAEAGLSTPRLLDSKQGRPWADLGAAGIWRVMTFVPGASFETVERPAQARAAGELVGRFHAALDGLKHEFTGRRLGVHDTARHLATLARAVAEHGSHRLHAEVQPLAAAITEQARHLPALPELPERPCHGDLKFNNLRFAGASSPEADRAVCLIDLDTLAPMPLAHELGDAWRSWCNPAGEDEAKACFDLAIFEAAWSGYRDGLARPLALAERQALLGGVEWMTLELAARFAADTLLESYFGFDESRFPAAGEHHLRRARSQWTLHEATVRTRAQRAALLAVR